MSATQIRLSQINLLVDKARREGRSEIHYTEIAAALGLSPYYTYTLLKMYSVVYRVPFEKGRLILKPTEGKPV